MHKGPVAVVLLAAAFYSLLSALAGEREQTCFREVCGHYTNPIAIRECQKACASYPDAGR